MDILILSLLILLGVGLILAWGLLSIFESMSEDSAQGEPTFREPGPIFHDHHVEQQVPRSQFAWQSRSHSRAPD
jgi:hypothetical protein